MITLRYCMSLSVRPPLFTFVYDIMRGKSANPNVAKLDRVAQALKVERNWLIHGMGEVQDEEPIVERPKTASSPSPWAATIWSSTRWCGL